MIEARTPQASFAGQAEHILTRLTRLPAFNETAVRLLARPFGTEDSIGDMEAAFRSDPGEFPYVQAGAFVYHPEWTGSLFRPIGFIVGVMCIDPHDELRSAWRALIAANFPPQATAALLDVSNVDYAAASGMIQQALKSPIEEIKLASRLNEAFRAQYRRAAELAREGK